MTTKFKKPKIIDKLIRKYRSITKKKDGDTNTTDWRNIYIISAVGFTSSLAHTPATWPYLELVYE